MQNTGHWRTPKEIFARVLSLSLFALWPGRAAATAAARHCCHGSCRSSLLCTRFVRLKSGFCLLASLKKRSGIIWNFATEDLSSHSSSFFSRFPRACWIRQIVLLQSVTDLVVGLVSSQATMSCWIIGTPPAPEKNERGREREINFFKAAQSPSHTF